MIFEDEGVTKPVHVHLSDLMTKDEFLTYNIWRQQHKIREVFLLIIKHNQSYFPMTSLL